MHHFQNLENVAINRVVSVSMLKEDGVNLAVVMGYAALK